MMMMMEVVVPSDLSHAVGTYHQHNVHVCVMCTYVLGAHCTTKELALILSEALCSVVKLSLVS